MDKIVKIEIKSVYGKETIYPANETAHLLTALTRKVTLDQSDLAKIVKLGYKVEINQPYSIRVNN